MEMSTCLTDYTTWLLLVLRALTETQRAGYLSRRNAPNKRPNCKCRERGTEALCAVSQRGVPDSDRRASQTLKCQSRGPSPRRRNVGGSGSRVVEGREWRVEGGGVGCIKSRPECCLALNRRPPLPQPRGRSPLAEGRMPIGRLCLRRPLLRAAWTSSGVETLQGTVESCNAQYCMRRALSRLVNFSIGRSGRSGARSLWYAAECSLGVECKCKCRCRCRQGRGDFNRRPKKVAVSDSGWYYFEHPSRSQELAGAMGLMGRQGRDSEGFCE